MEMRNRRGDLKKMVQIWIGQHKDNKVDPGYITYALGQVVSRGGKSTVLAQLTDEEVTQTLHAAARRRRTVLKDWKTRKGEA